MTAASKPRQWIFWLMLIAIAVGVTLFLTVRLFSGSTPDEWYNTMLAADDYGAIVMVNALVGISVALLVHQLRWNALRVIVTVIVALILGYVMTIFFNLDTADKYTRGEFKVSVLSEAAPVENADVDLEYGLSRGGEFNKPNVKEPLTEAVYTFAGSQGDVVSILAFVANRRSTVNLEVELLGPDGAQLAASTGATEEEVERFSENDVRSADDAVIADFALPADGVYTIQARPEVVPTNIVIDEALTSTNAAYDAFLLGALGRVNRWAIWIQDALTLILVGLSIAIVFRAQQFSLGAEGQLYLGALASGAIVLSFTQLPAIILIPLAILGALVAGFLWGLLPGALKAYLGANELVATLMLNTVAIRFFEMVLIMQLKPPGAGYNSSEVFVAAGQLAPIVANTQVTIAVYLVIITVIVTWLLISRTPLGYEIRMVGANRKFAEYGGVNTRRTIMLSMAVSGIVAGLAGAHLSMGIFRQLVSGMSFGLAFEGVVVALLARNNPLVIPFTGLLYAYLRAGAQFMERDANVSFEIVRIIQSVIILLITAEALVAFFQSRRRRQRSLAQSSAADPGAVAVEEGAHV
ncbi:MAG: ABC transporter permease [Anaerolineaceae bacterium]|nr:ABC transporter permease [Anaerolineaceae bacterium]